MIGFFFAIICCAVADPTRRETTPPPLTEPKKSPKAMCCCGEPSAGPSCRCFRSQLTDNLYCLPRPGHIACDFDTDCGMSGAGGVHTTIPATGLQVPAWVTFAF